MKRTQKHHYLRSREIRGYRSTSNHARDEFRHDPVDTFGASLPAAPSLALLKSGGAIHGIGERFSVNLSTGAGSTSIPVRSSPSRDGLQPQLSLECKSGAGNGPFVIGWRLSHSAVSRKTSKRIPLYGEMEAQADADIFFNLALKT